MIRLCFCEKYYSHYLTSSQRARLSGSSLLTFFCLCVCLIVNFENVFSEYVL